MRFPRAVFGLLVSLIVLSAVSFAANQASCTFSTFSAPSGYALAQVNEITDDGTVVGQLEDDKSGAFVGFSRSADGKFTFWSAPNSTYTWFSSRNLSGVNVGSYLDNGKIKRVHGVAQSGKEFVQVDYPNANHTWLYSINTLGAVVGSFSDKAGVVKGFKLIDAKYTVIKYPRAAATTPESINDNNVVVGHYSDGAVYHGFVWQGGKYTTVDYPKAKFGTVLSDVNNYGVIVGNHLSADYAFGFIYQNGAFANIVYAGAKSATVGGINSSGVISGEIYYSQTKTLGYTAVCK